MINLLWSLSLFFVLGLPIAFLEILYNLKTPSKNKIVLIVWLGILFCFSIAGLFVSLKHM